MHRHVDPPGEQRLVDLLGEQALAADVGECAVLHPVAGGDYGHDLGHRRAWMRGGQQIAHHPRLSQRQPAAATADA